MHLINPNNYKDTKPITTINKIRNILGDCDILPIEKSWFNSVHRYYSINLKVPDINIGTNGKGVSYELALASAYGEFMERLQNQVLYRGNVSFSEQINEYKGFKYSPDEVYLTIEDILNESYNNIKIYFPPNEKEYLSIETIKKWTCLTPESDNSKILCIPFYNCNDDNLCYVPLAVLDLYYGSNGMCAGNSKEEATVEGICEILERYVKFKILSGEIVPPTIPLEYIEKFPDAYNMIKELESLTNYKVIVKDCSLNHEFPVVGVVVIDSNDQKYFWGFGAHPVFQIALERTLTEILQGKDIKNLINLVDFSYFNNSINNTYNKLNSVIDGKSYYPTKVFTSNYSYEFAEYKDMTSKNNKEMLQYLITLLKNKNLNILIRDVSFMKFHSYQIIIPTFSEFVSTPEIDFNTLFKRNKVKKIIKNLNSASFEELTTVIEYMREFKYEDMDSIVAFVDLPFDDLFPWHNIRTNLFIYAAYYKMGNLKQALSSISEFVKNMSSVIGCEASTYYKCVRDYIAARTDGLNEIEIRKSLELFYEADVLEQVILELKNPAEIFDWYGYLNCWNCDECDYNDYCNYKKIEKIHLKIKDMYFENPINQFENRKLIK